MPARDEAGRACDVSMRSCQNQGPRSWNSAMGKGCSVAGAASCMMSCTGACRARTASPRRRDNPSACATGPAGPRPARRCWFRPSCPSGTESRNAANGRLAGGRFADGGSRQPLSAKTRRGGGRSGASAAPGAVPALSVACDVALTALRDAPMRGYCPTAQSARKTTCTGTMRGKAIWCMPAGSFSIAGPSGPAAPRLNRFMSPPDTSSGSRLRLGADRPELAGKPRLGCAKAVGPAKVDDVRWPADKAPCSGGRPIIGDGACASCLSGNGSGAASGASPAGSLPSCRHCWKDARQCSNSAAVAAGSEPGALAATWSR